MPTSLPPVLTTTPLVDPRTGILTRTGVAWFQSSYLRQGGQEAQSNTELASGVSDNTDQIGQVEDDLGQTNSTVASLDAELTLVQADVALLQTDLAALRERVTTLEGQVSSLETTVAEHGTRLAALEAWKAAVQAALPALVSVSGLPTLGDAPVSADAVRDDLTANWEPPLEANDTALAQAVNALTAALAA